MSLDELRTKIDEIDEEIIKKLEARFETVMAIGEYKKERSLPIVDYERELTKLEKVEELSTPLFSEYNKAVFMEIIEVSKDFQSEIVGERPEDAE